MTGAQLRLLTQMMERDGEGWLLARERRGWTWWRESGEWQHAHGTEFNTSTVDACIRSGWVTPLQEDDGLQAPPELYRISEDGRLARTAGRATP